MAFACCILLFALSRASAFVLDGSPTSFSQFPRWQAGLNGSLSLEFRTREPNGLLLYTDDGGTYDFFELKLVEGALRLRFNLGGGTAILTAGRNLHDTQWHSVQVIRNAEETILSVDDETQKRLTPGPDFIFGNLSTNSAVFMGGLPSWYGSKLTLLALPSAFFEPRFKGEIKDLVYASDDSQTKMQEIQESQGVRVKEEHVCEQQDPCQNGGICISTDGGPICDCRGTEYEGDFCEQKKPPSEATFTGEEYLYFDLRGTGGEPLVSWSDEMSLHFRSRQATGMLLYAGDGEDYLNLGLRGGGIVVTMGLGSGSIEKAVRPSRIRFDDNQWHKVVVHRKVREITRATGFCHLSITVDGVYTERGSTAGTFSLLSSSVLFVGGSDHTTALPGSRVRTNFVGCVRKVEFVADSVSLDLITLAKSQSKLLRHHGNLQFFCQEVEAADPITFTTRESFLALPTWEGSRSGTISFKFRTNEPTGLLMYNSGPSGQGDVFALELLDGHMYLVLGLGSGVAKIKSTARRADDGQWHSVSLRRNGKTGRIIVDEAAFDFATPGSSNQLDLEGPLYVGGLASVDQSAAVPSELWSAKLNYGYVGCLRDLVVNGRTMDIAAYAREQDSGSLRPSCHTSPTQCDSQPCMNGGICNEGWNRFICDCTRTSFTGPVCAKDATTLSFDGEQYLRISIPEGSKTQAEDVQLRFRTPRPTGLLLATTSDKSSTFLLMALEGGRLKVVINLGGKNKVIHLGQSLNDDAWHTVHLRRRGHKMDVHVDSETKSYDLGEDTVTIDVQVLHVGAVHPKSLKPVDIASYVGHMQHLVFNRKHYLEMAHSGQIATYQVTAKFGKKDNIVHHPITFKSKYTFLGLPQLRAYSTLNLYFQFKTLEPNGLLLYNSGKEQDFLAVELVNGHLQYVFNLGDGPRGVRSNTRTTLNDNQWHAVTIGRPSPHQHTLMVDDMITKVRGMYLQMKLLRHIYILKQEFQRYNLDILSLHEIRWTEDSDENEKDTFYSQLQDILNSVKKGDISLVLGDFNAKVGTDSDLWAGVLFPFGIGSSNGNGERLLQVTSPGPNTHLDLHGLLYLGGVRRSMYTSLPRLVHSRHGFQGCLASLDLNGETGDPIRDALIPSTLVSRGCAGPITKCSNSACANHGVCVQLWNGYACDCDMTSFSGPICADESISYEFGPRSGIITYTYPSSKRPDTRTDLLALGFITMADNGVLARIDSGKSNDYMELEIVDGNVFMVYNMGTEDHPIGEHSVFVNDGQYHVVRFTRSGPNSTIQVDDHNVRTKQPPGRQLTMFNSLSTIQVGGKRNPLRGNIERPFQGIISGLVVNGDRILDMAAEDDPKIRVDEDVELLMSLPYSLQQRSVPTYPQMQQQPGASAVYEGDDLVYNGGSGCYDDEDECGVVEFGSGDDLISPVYIPPTPKPQPRTTPEPYRASYTPGRSLPGGMEDTTCDDEEDCVDGSGLGELVFTGSTEGGTYHKPDDLMTSSSRFPDEVRTTPAPPPPPPVPTTVYKRPLDLPRPVFTQKPVTTTVFPPLRMGSTTRTPPSMNRVPIPEMPVTDRERQKPLPKSKSSADNTAMVIGIIAGVLIVIVIVALVVYRVRSWTAGGYKVDESNKRYHFPPASASPVPYQPPHMNGSVKTADKMAKAPKKKDVKDLKECFVSLVGGGMKMGLVTHTST